MGLAKSIVKDFRAVKKNDPAACNSFEILINHTPLHGIIAYRLMHPLHRLGLPIIPRLVMNIVKIWTGIEIHPGAVIGSGFFIDHGYGSVIGETTEIGKNAVMFHNVTLGGTGKHHVKRHPTIGNNVLMGVGTTLLGPLTIGDNAKIGANTFIIMHDVPANSTVVGTPGRIIKLNGKKVNKKLKRTKHWEDFLNNKK